MLSRRTSVHPATIISCIALFVALSGASYAAVKLPKNSVGSKQIKKNSVTGAKVKNRSLTGADIKVSTLGKVPSSATADSAAKADSATSSDSAKSLEGGVTIKRVHWVVPYNTPATELYNEAGLRLVGECDSGGSLAVTAHTTVDNAMLHYDFGDGEYEYDLMNVGDYAELLGGDGGDSRIGQAVYSTAANTVSLNFQSEVDNSILGATGNVCAFSAVVTKT